MTAAVAHRGPDDSGTSFITLEGQPPSGLGHRRLAIIDLSAAGRQPMTMTPDAGGGTNGALSLIFNGEIYNYRELRSELLAEGHRFSTATDTEVLLHMYVRYGVEMLSRLNGIFAFAIYDGRAEGRPNGVDRGALFIARDQLGVKPLYYTETPRGVLFGSEMKALLRDPEVSREIDAAAMHYMLAYLWTPAPRTLLASVRKLEPGYAMLVHGSRIRKKWSYYDVPYDGKRLVSTFDEAAEALAHQLESAVRRQLVSDVPVGAFLSGGLDSSSIVAMMRRAWPEKRISCFTIDFPQSTATEGSPADLPYARRVARSLDVDLQEVMVEPKAIDRLAETIALLDEPQADPAAINALLIAERARSMGIPVLLSGAGGDDLFSGYRRHTALTLESVWTWMPSVVLRRLQAIATTNAAGPQSGRAGHATRRLAKVFAYANESAERRLIAYFWWSTEQLRRGLYSSDFGARVSGEDAAAPLLESLARIPLEHDPLQRMLYLETKHFLADHNLNYTDRAGMAVGVEVRVPLLDRDLVAFATRLPSNFKHRRLVGKAVFKRAMEPYLPKEIIYRRKTGFGVPIRAWLGNELREMVNETLSPSSIRRRGFFDADAVERLVSKDRAGVIDGSYTVFALMCIELWCRRFLDEVPSARLTG